MIQQFIKKKINNKTQFIELVASIYNIIHYNNSYRYRNKNNLSWKGAFLKGCKFNISGKNNTILFSPKARFKNCTFDISGNNCQIIVGGNHTIISNVNFCCQDDHSKIIIGDDFTMEGGHIAATEGEIIKIGNDCMFSSDIEIRNGDSHSIIKANSQERINWGKPVIIEDHVWLTAHVRVLKGSFIPHHSIIGNSSVVSKALEEPYSIYGGSPIRNLKTNIDWDRNRYKFKKNNQ